MDNIPVTSGVLGSHKSEFGLPNRGYASPEPITVISASGDFRLVVSDRVYPTYSYRVNSTALSKSSPYFAVLLGHNFAEGNKVRQELQLLKRNNGNIESIPDADLPMVQIEDVGRIGKVKDIKVLITDLLRILHGLEVFSVTSHVPLANLANLAVVADRFDALPIVKQYVQKNKLVTQLAVRRSTSAPLAWNEEKTRMKILVGLLLADDAHSWVKSGSVDLIMKGSKRWTSQTESERDEPLWWNLPLGIEEEMEFRRLAVIKTISSLQSHFLGLYSSGVLQCKMGYFESPKCDTYQLGEQVKFWARLGMMTLESTMAGSEAQDPYDGDIEKALQLLKQCPSYQIDKFHGHCGLRDRLLPCVSVLEKVIRLVGICDQCWQLRRTKAAWKGAQGALIWSPSGFEENFFSKRACLQQHLVVRDMFLSSQKNWTNSSPI